MTDLLSFEDALAVLDEMGLVVGDPGLLASAVARPAATVFGEDAYVELPAKVAALLESVVRNHALTDGQFGPGSGVSGRNVADAAAGRDDRLVLQVWRRCRSDHEPFEVLIRDGGDEVEVLVDV